MEFDVLIVETVLRRRFIVVSIVPKILSGKLKNIDVEEEIYGH